MFDGAASLLLIAASKPDAPPAWLVPLFVVGFPLMWIAIGALLGALSGWGSLAGAYPHDGEPPVQRRSAVSGRVGLVNYNNVLTVGHDDVGLYLGVMFLFRIGHPPMRVPWEAIQARRRKRLLFLFQHDVLEILVGTKRYSVTLPAKVTADFESFLPPVAG